MCHLLYEEEDSWSVRVIDVGRLLRRLVFVLSVVVLVNLKV